MSKQSIILIEDTAEEEWCISINGSNPNPDKCFVMKDKKNAIQLFDFLTETKKSKVFLGGTCNESSWRKDLIPMLDMNYFNPVVDDWNKEAQQEEEYQKEICTYHLYTITPKMTGVYSIAEVVDDSNKRPGGTIFCILSEDERDIFTEGQVRSLSAVADIILRNGGEVFYTLNDVAKFINQKD